MAFRETRICVICGKEYEARMYRQRQCNSKECRRLYNLEGAKVRNKRRIERNKTKKIKEKKWNNLDLCVNEANELNLSYGIYMAYRYRNLLNEVAQ